MTATKPRRASTAVGSAQAPPPRGAETRARILAAALDRFRECGYVATTIDEICAAAAVTKGSFFHHFESKEAAALAVIDHWNETTGAFFAEAAFWSVADPRDRLLAYVDFRAEIAQGEIAEISCLLGMLAQEIFDTHPSLRSACGAGLDAHAATLVPTIEEARSLYAPGADWSAEGLALHIQSVLQGAFVLAKAKDDPAIVRTMLAHVRRYVECLLPPRRELTG